jgi:hypothetical protein
MPFLPARNYESEHTKFIRDLLAQRPQVDEDRRKGRAIWWDKQPGDLAHRREMDEGKVPQKGYVYSTE